MVRRRVIHTYSAVTPIENAALMVSRIMSDGPECPASSIPRRGSSRHKSGVSNTLTMNAVGSDTIAARTNTTRIRIARGRPFRSRLGCATIPVPRSNLHSTRFLLILSVRVPTSQPPERPGQILREEFIKSGRLTQAALATRMGVPVTKIRNILSGEEGITAETALQLEAALGVEAEFWIRAQFVWDCYRLREVERRTAVLEHEGKGAKRAKG